MQADETHKIKFRLAATTLKTSREIWHRIPNGPYKRMIYLSQVIREPEMNQWEWGQVPVLIISRLILCIDDLLYEYGKMKDKAVELMQTIEVYGSELSHDRLNQLSKERDNIIDEIDRIEDDFGEYYYSNEKIKKLEAKQMASKKKS